MRYCGMCGTALVQTCLNCKFVNPIFYHFCGMCGSPLDGTPAGPRETLQPEPAQSPAVPAPSAPEQGSAQPPASLFDSERRVVTVIITDITGSTSLLEKVGNETWVELMNEVLHLLETEVTRFGGQVEQFRGDGMVAFFGATSAHEDDPERAVLAALSMQEAIEAFTETLAWKEEINLKLRVGVNTGEVIAASDEFSRQRHQETAMGMGITVASRMESAAEPGTVLVSEYTYRMVESQFEWLPLGEITVKGLSTPVAGYRPLAPIAETEVRQRLEVFGSSIPLIGRQAEFELLKSCIAELQDGRGSIVLLSGEAGIGKSYLISELRQYFARQGALLAEALEEDVPDTLSFTWLRGRCRSYDKSWPYSVWLDVLHQWLGTRQGQPKEEIRGRLHGLAEDLWGSQMAEFYPYLATFLSLPLEEAYSEKVRYLNAEGLKQQFFLTLRSWVEALANRGPVVLAFTDMQWADVTSLDLLKFCISLADSEALVWLIVFRPERDSPVWDFRHHVETNYPHRLRMLEMSPLTDEQSVEFVDALVGTEALSPETRSLLIKSSDGNPYYILELIHSLIDSEVLIQDCENGRWCTKQGITTLDLPDNLSRLLQARIDRLTLEERHVLQIAAVIGQTFWLNVLQALVSETIPLKECLTALQKAQLIIERTRVPDLGMEYVFKSSLIRDAAYESLLSSQRSSYHLRVAVYFEENVGLDSRKQYEALIAYHYQRAGNPNKELFYTLRAAEQAREVYANAEALRHYTRALELLDEMQSTASDENQRYAILTQRFEVLDGRLELQYLLGYAEAGSADARALLPLAQEMSDDPAWMIDALLRQPSVRYPSNRDQIQEGLRMAHDALALSQQLSDRHREMRSLIAIANLYHLIHDHRWQETDERALALSRELGDQRTEVNLLLSIGNAYGMDDLERSAGYLEKALPIIQKLNDKRTEQRLLKALADQCEREGDYNRLLTEYEQKRLQIAREIGDRVSEGFTLMYIAQAQGIYLGDFESALPIAQEALHKTENLNSRLYPILRLAQIQAMMGRYEDAQESLEIARPVSEMQVDEIGRAGNALVTAILYNLLGDRSHLNMVLELGDRVIRMVGEKLISRQYQMAAQCEMAAAHLGLADLAEEDGERQSHLGQALEGSRAAADIYGEFRFTQVVECSSEEILFRHSRTLSANGYTQESREYFERAYRDMMRKYELIPVDSPFRRTYLENIALHREIRTMYQSILLSGDWP